MDSSTSSPKFRIQCHGGCLDKMQFDMDSEKPEYTLYGHKYEASGRKLGDHWVYVKAPKNRRDRLVLLAFTKMLGRDPRLDDIRQPAVSTRRGRNEPCYCGSGKKYKKCHGA